MVSCWVCFTAPASWELVQEPNGRKQGAKGHPGFGDKGTPWVWGQRDTLALGTKGIWAAGKGQESSRELVTPRECSWPASWGDGQHPCPEQPHRVPQHSRRFEQSCSMASWCSKLSLELPGTQTGALSQGSCHSQLLGWLWLPELCHCRAEDGQAGIPSPTEPGLRLQLENVSIGRAGSEAEEEHFCTAHKHSSEHGFLSHHLEAAPAWS